MTTVVRLQRVNHGAQYRAHRLRAADPALIAPFRGLDHAWVGASPPPPGECAGLATLTYLFLNSETGIACHDALGQRDDIQPGGAQWMPGGRPTAPERITGEVGEPGESGESGKTAHLLQVFVDLAQDPAGNAGAQPTLKLAPPEVPVVHLPDARVRVPLGRFAQARSTLAAFCGIDLLDVTLDRGGELSVPLPARRVALVLPVFGAVAVDGQYFHSSDLATLIFPAAGYDKKITLQGVSWCCAKAVLLLG